MDMKFLVPVSPELKYHLSWWEKRENVQEAIPLTPPEPELVLEKDASLSGWGGHIVGQDKMVQGVWTQVNAVHINVLEMREVLLCLQRLKAVVQNKCVGLRCDN